MPVRVCVAVIAATHTRKKGVKKGGSDREEGSATAADCAGRPTKKENLFPSLSPPLHVCCSCHSFERAHHLLSVHKKSDSSCSQQSPRKNGSRPFYPQHVSSGTLCGRSDSASRTATMSAKPQVTITLGRSGQVVKRAGASPEVAHSDYGRSLGGKRPIRERLGNNSDGCYNQSQSKFQRSDRYKWSSTDDDHRIGRNDLRFKLMRKNLPRQTNIDSGVHDLDLREKLPQTAQMAVRFDTCRHETESKTSGFLEQIPLRRSADDLLHMNSLRKSYSPWPLDGFRQRSPDRLLGAYRGLSPPRNYCDDLKQAPAIRSADPPTLTPILAKCVIDAPRPVNFASKAHVPVEHPKPVMQLPLPNAILKTSYMAEEPTSVGSLLHSLGLGKYAILFEAEEVDMAALKQMGDNDLKELGIPMGPRKKILLAVSSRPRQRHA